ncbi:MAG: glycosyltransferase family 4 protein [Bacteroidales bacterium]|jgi:glycosyltransferase involved in cell wall biosynthesis|nr:glycosyltransferase family 4 protein [Bacteroidales bacterium]
MKLLILTQYYPPETGAPQVRLSELAQRLQQKGVYVSVLTAMPNYPQMIIHKQYKGKCFCKEQINKVNVYRSWIYVPQSKAMIKRLLNYFSFVLSSFWYGIFKIKGKYDILFVESPPLFLGITAYLLAKFKRAKLVFNVSDLWPESAERLGLITNRSLLKMATWLEEFCYKKSFLITGQTQGIVNNIKNRFPFKRVHWLKNGIDVGYYEKDEKFVKGLWRVENKFAEDDFILFYGGIIGYAQGLDVILYAAEKLKNYNNIKFVVLGSGPEKQRLVDMKNNLDLVNVYFFDAVEKKKMRQIIEDIDASIIPLKRLELFKGAIPSKIFESLALRKPVLLGVEGEAKELFIDNGDCGLAFEPENSENLCKQILYLYSNKEDAEKMGENGLKYVSQNFSLSKITEDFYMELQKNRDI